MGLLDDLEQEAQRRKAGLDDAVRAKSDREATYKAHLEPGMTALYEYLNKLVANLTFLKPRKEVHYEIPGYGKVVALIEHEYDLKISVQPASKEITLHFGAQVATDECPVVEVSGASKIKSLNATFQKYRISALTDGKKDDSGEVAQAVFRPRGKVPLAVVISADAESATAKMNFTNFDGFGVVSKSCNAAQFNEALYDEVGRYIAREPNSLFREQLPDDVRLKLQQKVQQEQMRRKWEGKIADQQKEELERLRRDQAGKEGGLLGKVRGFFKKT